MKQATLVGAVIGAVLIGTSGMPASAGMNAYRCTATNLYEVDGGGVVARSAWNRKREPIHFAVDRADGRIVGDNLFSNSSADTVRVLNRGGAEWSFKLVSIWTSLREFHSLVIKEMTSGSAKPFVFTDSWGRVATGTCD